MQHSSEIDGRHVFADSRVRCKRLPRLDRVVHSAAKGEPWAFGTIGEYRSQLLLKRILRVQNAADVPDRQARVRCVDREGWPISQLGGHDDIYLCVLGEQLIM